MDIGTEIYDTSFDCTETFERLREDSKAPSYVIVEALYQRFQQWVSNMGVFARQNLSLDARLAYSESLRKLVVELLQIVMTNLGRIESLPRGSLNDASGETACSIIDQMSLTHGGKLSSLLIESLQALESAISGLHRLGAAIRQSSSASSLTQRINAFIQKEDNGILEDLFYVRLKYQLVDRAEFGETQNNEIKGAALSLCRQLAVSVSFRHSSILYRRSHEEKIAVRRRDIPVREQKEQPSTNVFAMQSPTQRDPDMNKSPTALPKHMLKQKVEPSDSSPTLPDSKIAKQKYASSQPSFTGNSTIYSIQPRDVRYPEPPKPIPPATDIVCPYCYLRFNISKDKIKTWWSRHIKQDLKIYTCISEECCNPPQLFPGFKEWKQHMDEEHTTNWTLEVHRPSSWYCEMSHDEQWFNNEREFEQHVRRHHPEYDGGTELADLKKLCEIRLPRQPYMCPVCNCIPEKVAAITPKISQLSTQGRDDLREELLRHIAQHLKEIGFLSILYLDDDVEEDSQTNRNVSACADQNQNWLAAGRWEEGEWISDTSESTVYWDPQFLSSTDASETNPPDFLEDWGYVWRYLWQLKQLHAGPCSLEQTHRQALEFAEKWRGVEHPDTLECLKVLANWLLNEGRLEEAEKIHRRRYDLCVKVLGSKHFNTIESMADLQRVVTLLLTPSQAVADLGTVAKEEELLLLTRENLEEMQNNLWRATGRDIKYSIQDAESFGLAFDGLLREIDSTNGSLAKDKVSAWTQRTRTFVKVLQQVAHDGRPYPALLWQAFFAALQFSFSMPKLRERSLDQIQFFDAVMPNFERPADIYNTNDSNLRVKLLVPMFTLYKSYIKFYTELIEFISESPRGSRLRSRINFTKEAKKALESTRNQASIQARAFQREADDIQRRLAEEKGIAERKASQDPRRLMTFTSESPAAESLSRKRSRRNKGRIVNCFQRTGGFFGRSDELSRIHNYLEGPSKQLDDSVSSLGDSEPSVCIIHGIGGVGKTKAALEYAYEHRYRYDWVFWVRADNPVEILKSFGAIMQRNRILDNTSTMDQNVLDWLETTDQRWLLVFDNVEEWDDIRQYWPRSTASGSSIIFTTQTPADSFQWSDNTIEIRPLDTPKGSALLLRGLQHYDGTEKERKMAMEITNIIGGLPLHLNQAAGYMNFTQCSLDEYLSLLHQSSKILIYPTLDKNLVYDKPWNAAFEVGLTRLSLDARDLLYILAFLGPEVDENVVFNKHSDEQLAFLRSDGNDEKKWNMLAQLRDRQLVEREAMGDTYFLITHRFLQRCILDKLNREIAERQKAFYKAFKILQAVLPSASVLQQPKEEMWLTIEKYLPLIQSLKNGYTRAVPKITGSLELATMFSQYGVDLYSSGRIKVDEELIQAAEDILDLLESQGTEVITLRANIHIAVGLYTDIIGITRRNEGLERRKKALDLRQQALRDREPASITRDEDILLHNAVMDLSYSYQQFNQFDKVEELSTTCFEKYKTWDPENKIPYEYAKYYHSMASVFVYQRQTERAVKFAKKAAELIKQANPGTVLETVYHFDWAIFLFQNDEVKEAIQEHTEVLEMRLQMYGRSNPLTLQSYITLGIMKYLDHDYESAEDWIRKVLIHHRNVDWPKENIARAKYYFSLVLQATKDPTALPRSLQPPNTCFLSPDSKLAQDEHSDDISREALATLFKNEARAILDELLPDGREDLLAQEPPVGAPEAILYDYMVPWGYRVVVKQIQPQSNTLPLR